MASNTPTNSPPAEPRRFTVPLPRPLWIGLAALFLIAASLGLRFVLPIYQRQTAVRRIEELGGAVAIGWQGGARARDTGERLGLLDDVVVIDLANCPATDATLEHMAHLESLFQVDVSNSLVTDAGLVHLKRLRNLGVIALNGTRVTDLGIAQLASLTELQILELENTLVTDTGIAKLQRALPRLRITK